MKKTLPFHLLLTASCLHAAPIFDESFDYSTGALSGTGGWSGSGSVVNADIGSVNPNNSGANAATVFSGTNIRNDLTTSAGVDYYFSYSINSSQVAATNAINGLHFQSTVFNSANSTTNASAAGISDGFFGVSTQASNNESGFQSSGISVSANTDYFIVGVIRTNDLGSNYGFNISASIFKTGDTLPTSVPTWDVVGTQRSIAKDNGSGSVRDPFQGAYMLTRAANTTFDDIVISTDFADVVPEPGSYALITGFLALGSIIVRRRR